MSANGIFDGPITNLLSILRILIEIFSRAHLKGEKALMVSPLSTCTGRFPSDGEASMTVKGLKTL